MDNMEENSMFNSKMTRKEFEKIQREEFEKNNIPVEFQGAISSYAYEKGHASGYNEILIHLRDLIYEFKNAIANFERRILRDLICEFKGSIANFEKRNKIVDSMDIDITH